MLEEHQAKERHSHDLKIFVEKGGILPAETCEGPNYTPQIDIEGLWAPYLAIVMDDPSSTGGFTHWLIWNIPGMVRIPRNIPKSLEVSFPIPAMQGKNSFDRIGYSGPCPPEGEVHTYSVRVYGLDGQVDAKPGSNREDLEKSLSGHIVQYGQADVRHGRKG
jgi:Raf kinase inhibitor-like YbhB/YbcL family protein